MICLSLCNWTQVGLLICRDWGRQVSRVNHILLATWDYVDVGLYRCYLHMLDFFSFFLLFFKMILVDATVLLLLAEDSPTEKWALWSFSLWTLTFDWKWHIGNEDYFLLLHFYSCAFWAHVDRWFNPGNWHAFISHTVLMQVSGNVKDNSIFYFYCFKLLEKFQVLMYCAITMTSLAVWDVHCRQWTL